MLDQAVTLPDDPEELRANLETEDDRGGDEPDNAAPAPDDAGGTS